jgi:hypothetical protein
LHQASGQAVDHNNAMAGTRRKTRESSVSAEEPNATAKKRMRPVTTSVSSRKIRVNWVPMSENGQREIMTLLDLSVPPIVQSIGGETKQDQLQRKLSQMLSGIQREIARVPVPLSTQDNHYSFEKMVQRRDQLENSLVPMLEQISLLEQEIAREERNLGDDKAYLDILKADSQEDQATSKLAKTAMELFARQSKRVDMVDTAQDIELESPTGMMTMAVENRQLDSIMEQLSSQLGRLRPGIQGIRQLLAVCEDLESVLVSDYEGLR